ncbi:MAG: tRNA lysidine(34) synthetase TilS [Spirochaetes bacterium]|nr:tRNA lysidine(34) synthetase TilS [Spirochaetota bacterium]
MKSTESKTSQIVKSAEKALLSVLSSGSDLAEAGAGCGSTPHLIATSCRGAGCNVRVAILLAFSAGADSTVLLDVLFRLRDKLKIKVIAAYFNHCLRSKEEIEEEITIAKNNCHIRDVPIFIGKDSEGTIEELSKKHGVEAAARKARYGFFYKAARENNCKYIAVAHNLEDNLETIIMRFFQGSGPEGLKGMKEKSRTSWFAPDFPAAGYSAENCCEQVKFSCNIIRPLINVKKMDILEYLEENKIRCSFDSTNKEDDYLRNRIRNQLVPVIKKVFPGYEKSLLSLAEKMARADNIVEEKLAKKIEWKKQGDALVTEYDNFIALPDYLKVKAVYNAFNISENSGERLQHGCCNPDTRSGLRRRSGMDVIIPDLLWGAIAQSERRLPYSFLKPLFSKNTGKKSNIILKGHNYILERDGKSLFWKRDIEIKDKTGYHIIAEPGREYELPVKFCKNNKRIYIFSKVVNISECGKDDLWIPVEKINSDIYIRNRHEGDFINFEYGKKTLKKLFLEMKIERYFRDLIPVICNNKEEILAVWGSVFDYGNRVSKLIFDADKNDEMNVAIAQSERTVLLFRARQG